jgi:DNA ligase (NAD+)
MYVEGLGASIVDQLIAAGKLKTFADLYRLAEADIAGLTGENEQNGKTVTRRVGEKTAAKIVANIASTRQLGLERLLAGLGIRHVGTTVARLLAESFGSLDALAAAGVEQLESIHGMGEVIARSVHEFFRSPHGRHAIEALREAGINPLQAPRPAGAADGELKGQTVVVTGTMERYTREEIEALIAELGGKPSGSVSRKTSFVVAGPGAGSKLDKAKELGVPVMSEAEFLGKVGK